MVSLTTYGSRFANVHLAIESIAAGAARPRRLVLWLDDARQFRQPTPGLRRLMDRGLELRVCEDLGPHKKYFPALEEMLSIGGGPLVIADDDLLYPGWWLQRLMNAHLSDPEIVVCHRAHRVLLEDQEIRPYTEWHGCWSTSPSLLHFATHGAGAVLPDQLQRALFANGKEFLRLTPRADDVWLHAVAVSSGIPTRQVSPRPRMFPFVPGSQDVGLFQYNIEESGNDQSIRRVYGRAIVDKLCGHDSE